MKLSLLVTLEGIVSREDGKESQYGINKARVAGACCAKSKTELQKVCIEGMEYVLIPITAVIASGLTLFPGFGPGALLMPVLALFFPIEAAIVLTAIVHRDNTTV